MAKKTTVMELQVCVFLLTALRFHYVTCLSGFTPVVFHATDPQQCSAGFGGSSLSPPKKYSSPRHKGIHLSHHKHCIRFDWPFMSPNVVVFVHIPSSQKIFWWQVQGVIRSAFATSGMPLNWRLQRSTTANTAHQNMSLQRLLTKLQFPQQQTYGQPPVLWHGEVTRHSRHYIHSQLSASPSNFCFYLCFYVALQIPSHVCVLLSHRPVGVITYLWYVFFFFTACVYLNPISQSDILLNKTPVLFLL